MSWLKLTVGKVIAWEILHHIEFYFIFSLSYYIYVQNFFTKFCRLSKNAEHKQDFNTYVLLDSHSSNLYPIFFQAKALMTSQVNTWKKTLLLSTFNVHSLIIATIAIHLFLKRLWIGKNVPCTQNCNLLFKEQLNPITIYTVKISTTLRWCTTGYSHSVLSRWGLAPIVLGPGLLLYLRILACGAWEVLNRFVSHADYPNPRFQWSAVNLVQD